MPTIHRLAVFIPLLAFAAAADPHPCTEQGLLDAIGDGGGPHRLDCANAATIIVQSTVQVSGPVILETSERVLSPTIRGSSESVAPIFHVQSPAGDLELRNFSVAGGSTAGMGGVFLNEGVLTLRECAVLAGSADGGGGGIANLGSLLLEGTGVAGNVALGQGGGVLAAPGSTTVIRDSTLAGNHVNFDALSKAEGGALFSDGSTVLESSTFSGNHSDEAGSAVYLGGGSTTLRHVTVAEDTSPSAIPALAGGGGASVSNSLLSGHCAVPLPSLGGNVESPGSSCLAAAPEDRSGVGAAGLGLGPLDWNGGPTATRRLLPGSLAIDWIDGPACTAGEADQRGAPRPDRATGTACDAGAYESTRLGLVELLRVAADGDPDPQGGGTVGGFMRAATSEGHVALFGAGAEGLAVYLWDDLAQSLVHVAGVEEGFCFGAHPECPASQPGESRVPELAANAGEFGFFYPSVRIGPGQYLDSRGLYRFGPGQGVSRCAGLGDPISAGPENQSVDTLGQDATPPGFDLEPGGMVFVEAANDAPPQGNGLYRCGGPAIVEVLSPVAASIPDVYVEGSSILFPRSNGLHEVVSGGGSVERKPLFRAGPEADASREAGVTYAAEPVGRLPNGTVFLGQVSDDGSGSFETSEAFFQGGGLAGASVLAQPGSVFAGGDLLASSIFDICEPPFAPLSLQTSAGGVLEPLIQPGDVIDGKELKCIGFYRDGAEGDQLAFVARFTDESRAVYRAPEPSTRAGLLSGGLFVAILMRASRARVRIRPGLLENEGS